MNEIYNAIIRNGNYFGNDRIILPFKCVVDFTRFGATDYRLPTHNKYFKINFDGLENHYKVFICSNEPNSSVNRETVENIISNSHHYDLILTTEQSILKECGNSVYFPYGGTWLNKDANCHNDSLGKFKETILDKVYPKKFNVSFLATSHLGKEGYNLRQTVWNNRDKFVVPTIFYSSTRYPTNSRSTTYPAVFSNTLHDGYIPEDDKIHIFKSQFSIAIESSKEDSYFTEKLIDCLLTKTVPIYWGANNIGDIFDKNGIICVDTFDDLVEKINQLTEDTYESMKDAIERNYIIAQEYGRPFFERIQEQILKHQEKMNNNSDVLWTIGILSLPQRTNFLERLTQHISSITPVSLKNKIEVLVNIDNKTKTVGQKRNEILDQAKGKYVCFIDDDDMISFDYVAKISNKLLLDRYDGIGFCGIYYHSGTPIMNFNHANINNGHFKKDGSQYRPLNHLNPVRTEIARQIRFPEKNYGEDSDYCDKLLSSELIHSEYNFEDFMYHYLFDPKVTETQK